MSSNIVQKKQLNQDIIKSPSIKAAKQKVQQKNKKLIEQEHLQTRMDKLKQKINVNQNKLKHMRFNSYIQNKVVQQLRLLFGFVFCLFAVYVGGATGFFTSKVTFYLYAIIEVVTLILFITINRKHSGN